MNVKKSLLSNVTSILKDELTKSDRPNKFLLLAIIANIPSPLIFVPYLTEAITIILVAIYLKNYPKVDIQSIHNSSVVNKLILGIPTPIFGLSVLAILIQLDWFPFASQLISIAILSLLFVFSRNSIGK
jgi:ABC-type phosphate transport system permease subunit